MTIGDVKDAVARLHELSCVVPKHQRGWVDAAALASRLLLQALEPHEAQANPSATSPQWRDTRADPMPTQLHPGYAETQLERTA